MKLTAFSYLDTHAPYSKAIHLRPAEKNLCDACSLKSKFTSGRAVNQRLDEEHHYRVRSCCRKFRREKAQRKHKAGAPLRRGREGNGMRMVRLRMLERISAEVLMTVSGQNVKRAIAGVRTPGTKDNGAWPRPKRCARLRSSTYAIYVAIARTASA